MEDYNPQVDDLEDESDKYYLLAKQHAEADALARSLFPHGCLKKEANPSVTEEPYRDFTPKFQPVPTPANADEEWYKMIARLEKYEQGDLHRD